MIKVLILYYLSVKSTHGYEIQKFIQANYMDQWTKIQSGSIYYAIARLEKEGLIRQKNGSGATPKARKTFEITDTGRIELKELVKGALQKELFSSGSDKFIIYPILNTLDKSQIIAALREHIDALEKKKDALAQWRRIKITVDSLDIERLTFAMMQSSLRYQIKWHETLIRDIDRCMEASRRIAESITQFDFSAERPDDDGQVQKWKNEILQNPENAAEKLDILIRRLKK